MARTRSEKAHHDVVQAAVEVLLRVGVGGFTIDEVVARSGVAKTTIYRWWPNRQALLLDAAHSVLSPTSTPNSGDTRADLVAYLSNFVTIPRDTPAGRLLPELCSVAQRDPEMAELRDTLIAEKRQPVLTILQLAAARGDIDPGADVEQLASLLIGPLAYTKTLRGLPVDASLVEVVVDSVLAYCAVHRVAT